MKPWSTSALVVGQRALGDVQLRLRRAAWSSAWRSRQWNSVSSSWPISWPACTRSPSRTPRLLQLGGDLGLDDGAVHRLQPARHRQRAPPARCAARRATSPGARSTACVERAHGRGRRGLLGLARQQRAGDQHPPTTSSTSSGIHGSGRLMRGSAQRGRIGLQAVQHQVDVGVSVGMRSTSSPRIGQAPKECLCRQRKIIGRSAAWATACEGTCRRAELAAVDAALHGCR
jgi:hypothetical protein